MKIRKTGLFLFFALWIVLFQPQVRSQCTSVQLDGVDEYLHTAFNNYTFNHFTLEIWINVPEYNSNIHYISLFQNAYLVLGDYGIGSFSTWADGLNPIDIGPSSLIGSVNVWHHVAFVYDGTNQYIYIDGLPDRTVLTSGNVTHDLNQFNQGLNIGARYTGGTQYRSGLLDEVRIWNVARTPQQIQTYMNQMLTGNEPGLIAYYPMEDGTGSSIASDWTANNNDLTLVNMEPQSDWVTQCPFIAIRRVNVTLSPNDTVCSGDTVTIHATGMDSYIWSSHPSLITPNDSTGYFFPTATDSVRIIGYYPPNGNYDTVWVKVTVLPTPYGQASASICAGDSVFVGGAFQTASGIYYDVFPLATGCDSTLETTLSLITVDTSVSVSGNTLTANAIGATYQWVNCEGWVNISGETAQSFSPSNSGDYAVIVTQNGCTDSSACNRINITGVGALLSGENCQIFPNPSSDRIFIDLEEIRSAISVRVSDELGKVVLTGKWELVNQVELDIRTLSAGVYFLKVEMDGKAGIFRVIKE